MVWITLAQDRDSLGHGILVDRAIFHDDEEILARICNEIDVLQRIAADQQQIRERTRFHDAELAGIGIALARQRRVDSGA